MTADEIIDRARETEATGFQSGEVTMTLIIQDESGESRERRLTVRGMDDGDDSRALVRVVSPPEQAGQSYLFRENTVGEDDVYIYLPAIDDSPRRISGDQKNGSFMGTHFTFSDLETRDESDAVYTRQEDETIGRFPVYVIDSTPGASSDSEYSRVRMWIRHGDFIPLRTRFFGDNDQEERTIFTEETAENDGRLYVRRMTLRPADGGATTMILDDVDFNAPVSSAEFTPQNLAN
ncbi:MAG: outer membrane lipoprotein-sorting protein [Bradymonadia bacterium]|jgi:outer membrane lipoprotein-sorting protein